MPKKNMTRKIEDYSNLWKYKISSKKSDNRAFVTLGIDQIFSQQPIVSHSEIGSKMAWCKMNHLHSESIIGPEV